MNQHQIYMWLGCKRIEFRSDITFIILVFIYQAQINIWFDLVRKLLYPSKTDARAYWIGEKDLVTN